MSTDLGRVDTLVEYHAGVEAALVLDLNGCARCHGDGHPNLRFEKLTHPVEADDEHAEHDFTHWAPCPTNGEPILLRLRVSP